MTTGANGSSPRPAALHLGRVGLVSLTLAASGCSATRSQGMEDPAAEDAGRESREVDSAAAPHGDDGAAPSPARDGGDNADDRDGDAAFILDALGGTVGDGAAPAGFWDTTNIPPAKNVMIFRFLNRTNGKYADSEVYWSFKSGSISETHSIAEQPTYDMPANSSGRVYFYLCAASDTTCTGDPTRSKYFDFIEHTIGAHQYNGNTTRVDAFGLKIAMRLHCSDGFDTAVGEDYETFQEDRAVTFQKFLDAVPAEFKPLAQPPHAPYRIVQPGAAGFDQGGANANYYNAFVDQIWSANGLTVAKPGPNGSRLGSYPNLSAAIYRHVGAVSGTFDASGKLLNQKLWADSSTFYSAAPADYYARFWHAHALGGKAYGFPYDDVGGYSSYVSHANPQYLLVAIGW
jgi:hypothetical protein